MSIYLSLYIYTYTHAHMYIHTHTYTQNTYMCTYFIHSVTSNSNFIGFSLISSSLHQYFLFSSLKILVFNDMRMLLWLELPTPYFIEVEKMGIFVLPLILGEKAISPCPLSMILAVGFSFMHSLLCWGSFHLFLVC